MNPNALPPQTLKALSDLIYGRSDPSKYIQRGPDGAHSFFTSAALPCGPVEYARNSAGWAEDRLIQHNQDSDKIQKAILHIVSWEHFLDKPEFFEPTLNRLQLILAPAGWTVEMDGIMPYLRQMPPAFRLQKQTTLPMEPTPQFSKINADRIWVDVLRNRWDEAERCIGADAPVMAIVALGSILEGALRAVAEKFPSQTNQASKAPRDTQSGRTKGFRDWAFWDFVEVAEELGWIGAEVHRLGHALRDYRNLVHPAQQVGKKEFPTIGSARACRQVVLTAILALIRWREDQGVNIIV